MKNITSSIKHLVLASVALSLPLQALAQNKSREERRQKGEVYINFEDEPPSMDPTKQADAISGMWLAHIYEGLITRDNRGQHIPGAAESWSVSPDGKTYTFHLRPNAKWHDGKPVTAKDFEYAFRRLVNPKFGSEYAYIAAVAQIENAAAILKGKKPVSDLGARATSDFTFEVKLAAPVFFFPSLMTFSVFYPVRSDIAEQHKEKFAVNANSVVGNGPFKLVKWVHDSSMRIEKAGTYWNESSIRLNAIEAPVALKDDGAAYNLFLTGGLDYVALDRDRLRVAQSEKRLIKNYADDSVNWLEVNHRNGRLFTNIKLRQALKMAIHRAEIANKVIGIPGSKPAFGVVPDYLPGGATKVLFRKENPLTWPDANIASAKKLIKEYLAETKQTKVPPFEILGDTTIKGKLPVEYLQTYLSGVFETTVRANLVPYRTHSQLMRDGDFDLAWIGWAPDYFDAMSMLERFLSDNENNYGNFSDKLFDILVRKAALEQNPAKRSQLLGEAEKILVDEKAGVIPCYQPGRAYLIADKLEGYSHKHLGVDPDFRDAKWR
jgi:oligopeptide transport system substrate-binding protein